MSYSPLFRGNPANATVGSTASGYQNGIGSTIPMASAVSTSTNGLLVLTDVTNEAISEAWVGLTTASLPAAATGAISADGRLQNIPLGLGFAVGDPIWVGVTPGSLTNVRPDVGQPGWNAGYFVLFVGVVVQNEFNPSNQDIQLSRQIIGTL